MIKLDLTIEEVNTIMAALAKAPYELSAPVIDKIKVQATPQVQAMQSPAPVEVAAE